MDLVPTAASSFDQDFPCRSTVSKKAFFSDADHFCGAFLASLLLPPPGSLLLLPFEDLTPSCVPPPEPPGDRVPLMLRSRSRSSPSLSSTFLLEPLSDSCGTFRRYFLLAASSKKIFFAPPAFSADVRRSSSSQSRMTLPPSSKAELNISLLMGWNIRVWYVLSSSGKANTRGFSGPVPTLILAPNETAACIVASQVASDLRFFRWWNSLSAALYGTVCFDV
mmetsp:Transcript_27929/g.82093  ORF Transcript_27929/g.82093 Transcript_27929/m.82093 type:complete len:222 (-) Transcript_27929:3233-3898(-)